MVAVITSQTVWPSAEGLDVSSKGEGKLLDEFALVFDNNSPMMSGQRGHHVLRYFHSRGLRIKVQTLGRESFASHAR
jgi:hypothetical protein